MARGYIGKRCPFGFLDLLQKLSKYPLQFCYIIQTLLKYPVHYGAVHFQVVVNEDIAKTYHLYPLG